MKTYETNDGEKFQASNEQELVMKLRTSSHSPVATDAEFMADVARRINLETGRDVPTADAAEFIKVLVEVGYLKELVS